MSSLKSLYVIYAFSSLEFLFIFAVAYVSALGFWGGSNGEELDCK